LLEIEQRDLGAVARTGVSIFSGSTKYVVLDNLREGVLKPDLYEPELNPVYAAMLAHYGCFADPARVRDPDRKGRLRMRSSIRSPRRSKGKRFESIEHKTRT